MASLIVPIKKHDNSVRVCVAYRFLNSVIIPDPFYTPSLDEVVGIIGNDNVIPKLYFMKDCYQGEVAEEDRAMTAIFAFF